MYAYSINPRGCLVRLDLDTIPVWRLELGTAGTELGVGLRYVTSGTTSLMLLAALDTTSNGNEGLGIAKIGLPRRGRSANKTRLHEAMKILHNSSLNPRKVDELISQSPGLVDVYFDAFEALTHGADASGEYLGYRWAIQREACPVKWAEPPASDDEDTA